MKNTTFRQLRVFSEVAKQLSFARAAENLHLTPPAVTMQVKELEGRVGVPLFERNGKQVSLTTAGEYILVHARKILSTLKDAEDVVARLQRLEVGQLTIGMVSTAKYFVPPLLAQFQREHEGIEIKLLVSNREQLVKMLHGNEVDIAIMGRPPKDLATRAEPFQPTRTSSWPRSTTLCSRSVIPPSRVCAPMASFFVNGVPAPGPPWRISSRRPGWSLAW